MDLIEKLIPQRFPFLLIDKLLVCNEKVAKSSFFIPKNHLLTNKEGFLTEGGIIENMAQTTAMQQGYILYKNNQEVKDGYLASISNLYIYSLPAVEEVITTEITIINKILTIVSIQGKVMLNDTIIAEGELKFAAAKG